MTKTFADCRAINATDKSAASRKGTDCKVGTKNERGCRRQVIHREKRYTNAIKMTNLRFKSGVLFENLLFPEYISASSCYSYVRFFGMALQFFYVAADDNRNS